MKMGNVTDITLGATYEAGVLTGGTLCASTGIELNFGNAVTFTPLISKEDVDVTNREVTGSTEFELTAAQEVAFMEQVKSNTTQSLSMIIGVEEGKKILLFAPAVQLITPKKVDLNGKRLIGYDLRAVPVAGNDELRIVCL